MDYLLSDKQYDIASWRHYANNPYFANPYFDKQYDIASWRHYANNPYFANPYFVGYIEYYLTTCTHKNISRPRAIGLKATEDLAHKHTDTSQILVRWPKLT